MATLHNYQHEFDNPDLTRFRGKDEFKIITIKFSIKFNFLRFASKYNVYEEEIRDFKRCKTKNVNISSSLIFT